MTWLRLSYLLSVIVLGSAGGCSDRKVHEFTSSDGKVSIVIFDPCECDQQKAFYAEVRNMKLASDQYPEFCTEWANCDDSFDPSSLVWLEGNQRCGVFASSVIKDASAPLSESLYGLIDRDRKRVICDFDTLPVEIRTECLAKLEQRRKQRDMESGVGSHDEQSE